MSNATARAAEALHAVPAWDDGTATLLESLGGGPTSETWLVSHRGSRYVLRLDTPLAITLGLNRDAESAVIRAAAAAGIGPELIYESTHHRLLVTRYVEGRAWTKADLGKPAQLARLAATLRRLHRLTPPVRRFDLRGAIEGYAAALGFARAGSWATDARILLDTVSPRPLALCHNDLVARNVVDGARLWLIDWEYGALGDPVFDVAVVVRHHGLDARCAEQLLAAALTEADPAAYTDFSVYCRVYDRLLALWYALLERHGALDQGQQKQLAHVAARIQTDPVL